MNRQLLELEQAFRQNWRSFNPEGYSYYLNQLDADQRLALLARLLGVELEFAFQPPSSALSNESSRPGPPSSADPSAVDPQRASNDTRNAAADEASEQAVPDGAVGSIDSADDGDADDDQRVKPCVPLFLLRFPELMQRSELVIRLIVLEYALRLRHDPFPPNPESYLPLCEPARDQLIRLLELTENKLPTGRSAALPIAPVGRSDSTIKEASLSASITLDPLPLNLGCFLLVRLLGRGGMGYVHAALDLRSTAQVAVKVMRRVDAWSIYRFIEEFRWLSQLSHPNLVKLYDTFCEEEIRYFSMELIEGKMIRDWFRVVAQRSESHWEKLRDVLGQLASAVEYLHQHQVVHCDLKCSNMMVTSSRRAVLLDLGLAIRAGQTDRLVGTLQYMAPEVIQGGSVSYASDWYSFGVMIFEVLTNTFPPIHIEPSETESGGTSYQLDLDQVRHLLGACPDALASLCIDLLQSNPARRPSGSDVIQRLTGESLLKPEREPLELCRGRDHELDTLNRALNSPSRVPPSLDQLDADRVSDKRCSNGWLTNTLQAGLVILRGEVGSGKTTLLNHWIQTVPQHDQLLLSVRCYRQDHTPHRLLNAIVQELTMAVPSLTVASWEPALEELADEICLLFPQIQQLLPAREAKLPPSPTAPNAADSAAQDVSLGSLVRWLVQLSQHRRLIICVDDAHWADLESLKTLKQLLDHTDRFQVALILIDESSAGRLDDVFRTDSEVMSPGHASNNGELEDYPAAHSPAKGEVGAVPYFTTHINLSPLAEEICRELLNYWAENAAISMAPTTAEELAQRSYGNPFLLKELFRAYVYQVNTQPASERDQLPKDLTDSACQRFSVLPQPAENILQYLAVAEHSLSFHQLQMASRIFPDDLQSILNWLASQGWINASTEAADSGIEIAHETFRRAILHSIPRERIHRRHYRLARVLSCETPPLWARVGNHYWAAEYFREASACYMEAARRAHAAGDWEEALKFLQRAEHPEAQRTETEKLYVLRLKADCLAGAGYSQAAAALYDQLQR